jgi:hypothetical protein
VINAGMFGSVKGTTIHMTGDFWRNTPNASFPDEMGINNPNAFTGTGGIFRFVNNSAQQYLSGSYSLTGKNGPAFPNLTVASPRGLFLYQTMHRYVARLHFETGLLALNDNNLVVGINDPGTITGYTENRFVATGNTNKGGYLYRSNISGATGSIVFPIGTQAGSYAPISIMFNATAPQSLHARVFDIVYSNGFFGTTGFPFSVQQTWNVGQENNSKFRPSWPYNILRQEKAPVLWLTVRIAIYRTMIFHSGHGIHSALQALFLRAPSLQVRPSLMRISIPAVLILLEQIPISPKQPIQKQTLLHLPKED